MTRIGFGLVLILVPFALVACDGSLDDREDVRVLNPSAADNSDVNKRDRDGQALTPLDQSESTPDIRITAEVRRAILADDHLSINADNVRVITSKGVVTLRGPVASEAERATVEAIATAVTGVAHVNNQLEVAR